MRILHTIRSVNPEGGGVIETVKQFSRVLEGLGHDVTIASLDAPTDPWVRGCPHRVEALGNDSGAGETPAGQWRPGRLPHYGYSSRFVPWLRENVEKFDSIIVNGVWQFHSFGVWKALWTTGKPYFVFPHGMLDPWFKRTYPLKHAKKWLYWPWAEYRVLRDACAVLFTCEQERELARKSFWLYRCRERVVPLGIARPPGDSAAQRELFWQRFPACRGQRLILFLGRIHEKKGCDLLLQAFAKVAPSHPKLQLVLAGPAQQDALSLRALAAQLGLADRVVWTGMLSGDMKWGALHAAEVFALPSHQENFGIAVVEALACGLPVLISREVNIWREVVEGGAGLAEADNIEGTTTLLQRWLDLSPAERERMRLTAQKLFAERFDIELATTHLLSVLQNRDEGNASPLKGDRGGRDRNADSLKSRRTEITNPHPLSLSMNLEVGRCCPQPVTNISKPHLLHGAMRTSLPYQRWLVQGFKARTWLREILFPRRGERSGECCTVEPNPSATLEKIS